MHPSRSTFDRLPNGISECWEMRRREWESELQAQEEVLAEVAVIGVSLDGVMAPMKDGQREAKREQSRQEGKQVSGPAGYREVGCGTVSLYDAEGERLRTVRFARMPEPKKGALKRQLAAEVEHVLKQYPNVPLVKVADGARDNWTFLSKDLPEGIEVVDFYPAAKHLRSAFDLIYGADSAQARAKSEAYRQLLLNDDKGVEKVIRTLAYQHRGKPCGETPEGILAKMQPPATTSPTRKRGRGHESRNRSHAC